MEHMRRRVPVTALFLLILTLLSGCGGQPATPEAAAETARAFMEARAGGNGTEVHAMLTARAQKAMSRSLVSRYLQRTRASFAGMGSPQEAEPGLVRIPVRDLALESRERTVRWPDAWLTLRREGKRWQVAWTEPLVDEATEAYYNDQILEQLTLAQQMVAIDPYHYRGHLELHFAYRELKRLREAEMAITTALERATPAQRPSVHDAFARFKLLVNSPSAALTHARQALDLAAPHIPGTYTVQWQADTLVVAGRAALAVGDRTAAETLAGQAAALDSNNSSLAVFRHQLAAKPSPPPVAR